MQEEYTEATIIMATYNGINYIESQLSSILRQTYQPLKVIIRDDGSNDGTSEFIKYFINQNQLQSTWDFQINIENKGWRRNFIDMLTLTDTKYIFYADQDDIWNEDKIYKTLGLMNKHTNINVLVSDYSLFGESGGEEKIKTIDEVFITDKLYRVRQTLSNLTIRRDGCAFAIRQTFVPSVLSVYENIGKDSNGLPQAHDLATWLAGILSDSLYHVREDLIEHRIHASSTWSLEAKKLVQTKNTISDNFMNYYCKILYYPRLTKESVYYELIGIKLNDFKVESDLIKTGSKIQKIFSFRKFSSMQRYLGFIKRNLLTKN